MLIAISGSQGCGKTTIITTLKKSTKYKFIERKSSRSILAETNLTLSEIAKNPELFMNFQEKVFSRKMKDECKIISSTGFHNGKPEVIITERSYMDLATYACSVLGSLPEYGKWLNDYTGRCIEAQGTYNLVLYLTSGHFPVEPDNVRPANPFYNQMIGLMMYHMTKTYTMPANLIKVTSPDLWIRERIISSAIHKLEIDTMKMKGF